MSFYAVQYKPKTTEKSLWQCPWTYTLLTYVMYITYFHSIIVDAKNWKEKRAFLAWRNQRPCSAADSITWYLSLASILLLNDGYVQKYILELNKFTSNSLITFYTSMLQKACQLLLSKCGYFIPWFYTSLDYTCNINGCSSSN